MRSSDSARLVGVTTRANHRPEWGAPGTGRDHAPMLPDVLAQKVPVHPGSDQQLQSFPSTTFEGEITEQDASIV
jgi:hypothetical protein